MALTDLPLVAPDRKTAGFRPLKVLHHFGKLVEDKEDTEQVFHIFQSLPRMGLVDEIQSFVYSDFGQQLRANADAYSGEAAEFQVEQFAFHPFSQLGGLQQAVRVFGNDVRRGGRDERRGPAGRDGRGARDAGRGPRDGWGDARPPREPRLEREDLSVDVK